MSKLPLFSLLLAAINSQNEEEGEAGDVEVSLSPALLELAFNLGVQSGHARDRVTILHHRANRI